MLKVTLYRKSGGEEKVNLPGSFAMSGSRKLISQAVRVYNDNLHPQLAKVKTRSQVDLTKKKAYRQKGTGYARHGAKSAPIFVGGGVAHGPKGVKRVLSLPKIMIKKALQFSLYEKIMGNELILIDFGKGFTKTKDAAALIIKATKGKKATLFMAQDNWSLVRYLKNIRNLTIFPSKNANPFQILFGGTILYDYRCFSSIKEAGKPVGSAKLVTKTAKINEAKKAMKKGVKK